MYNVAEHVNISPFYFHKGFSILLGYSITEYIRNRRLALAGEELITRNIMVMQLTMKYGYDSPDSFTKAFSRFHGYIPLMVRKTQTTIKIFAPLKLTISLKGDYIMEFFHARARFLMRCRMSTPKYSPNGLLHYRIMSLQWAIVSKCTVTPDKYPGTGDENYYTEIQLPAKKETGLAQIGAMQSDECVLY